jgi:hypothetical protein
MNSTPLRGGCLCGAVEYEIRGEPSKFYHCHCSRCRKSTGTGHSSNLFVQPATLEWLKGGELVRSFKIPEAKRFTRQFCASCGSPLPRQLKDTDIVIAPAGSLDVEPALRPQARIFWESRAGWSCGAEALPVHPEYPA